MSPVAAKAPPPGADADTTETTDADADAADAEAETETETEEDTAADLVLRPGDRGAVVKALQRRLHAGHYYYGKIHGVYDEQTKFAVWALQKSRRMIPRERSARRCGRRWSGPCADARWSPAAPPTGSRSACASSS
ncbi:peptidoglycan-binding protein [Nonomuraea antimicrobica]